jgi:hypothetical protein
MSLASTAPSNICSNAAPPSLASLAQVDQPFLSLGVQVRQPRGVRTNLADAYIVLTSFVFCLVRAPVSVMGVLERFRTGFALRASDSCQIRHGGSAVMSQS